MPETDPTPRVFSEEEHLAVLADRVTRETAALTGKVDTLTSERDELNTKYDAEVSKREAAELKATEAETKHTEYVAGVEAREAAAARRDERLGKIREAAAHLSDEFFADEARVERIVAMDDEHFEGYLTDIKASTSGSSGGSEGAPRETAMAGASVSGTGESAKAAKNFLMSPYVVPDTKGA